MDNRVDYNNILLLLERLSLGAGWTAKEDRQAEEAKEVGRRTGQGPVVTTTVAVAVVIEVVEGAGGSTVVVVESKAVLGRSSIVVVVVVVDAAVVGRSNPVVCVCVCVCVSVMRSWSILYYFLILRSQWSFAAAAAAVVGSVALVVVAADLPMRSSRQTAVVVWPMSRDGQFGLRTVCGRTRRDSRTDCAREEPHSGQYG